MPEEYGDYFIRNIPPHVDSWVRSEMERTGLRKTELLRMVLERAAEYYTEASLFDALSPPRDVVPEALPFRFIDLFAGIGGFRIGLTKVGGHCAFSCEYDKYARKTYCAWFNQSDTDIFGDINKLETPEQIEATIPDHDVMAAGFPCQPFSIAGVSKKRSLGHADGFGCSKQGNLFFKIRDIVKVKRPPVVFLENVKNLKSHDRGKTWRVILSILKEELEYNVFEGIVDATHWVPQHRERILIVCFDRHVFGDDFWFDFPPVPTKQKPVLGDILEETPDEKYILTDHLWQYLQSYAEKHRKRGNGFGFGLVGPEDQARTLSARYYKDGSEILIRPPKCGHPSVTADTKDKRNPRRLTIREAARLMGFSDEYAALFGHENGFPQVVSDTQAYRQFGNAVVPMVVEHVAHAIVSTLSDQVLKEGNGCLLKGRQSWSPNVHSGDASPHARSPVSKAM